MRQEGVDDDFLLREEENEVKVSLEDVKDRRESLATSFPKKTATSSSLSPLSFCPFRSRPGRDDSHRTRRSSRERKREKDREEEERKAMAKTSRNKRTQLAGKKASSFPLSPYIGYLLWRRAVMST